MKQSFKSLLSSVLLVGLTATASMAACTAHDTTSFGESDVALMLGVMAMPKLAPGGTQAAAG